MEIYRNGTKRTVSLNVPVTPVGNSMEVRVYEGSVLKYTVPTVTVSGGTMSFTLPFSCVQNDTRLSINWHFNYLESATQYEFNQNSYVDIVTPILDAESIRAIIGANATDAEVEKIERATRYIIQSHTGQVFGRYEGVKTITGSGDRQLVMPRRLLSFKTVNGSAYFNSNLALRGGGWYLINKSFGIPSLKADFHGLHYLSNGVIEAPPRIPRLTWLENVEYEIDGVWGWETIPTAVIEAAKLLVNDYSCGDNIYRDRYLNSISAVDWRIEFNAQAFAHTGNVRADQLLSNYVLKRGWAVV